MRRQFGSHSYERSPACGLPACRRSANVHRSGTTEQTYRQTDRPMSLMQSIVLISDVYCILL